MSTWQDKVGDAIKSVTDKQQALTAKAQRGIILGAESLEKTAAYQLKLAAEATDLAVAQTKLLGQPGNPVSYLKQQVGFVADGVQKARDNFDELNGILTDCAADMSALFDRAPKSKSTSRAKKAA